MNDALITPEEREKSLTQAAEQKIAPEIIATAAAIWRASEGTISKEAAIRAAFHFQTTGEVLGRDSYVGTKGSAKGQVIEGYRAVLRNIRQPYQTRFRPMNRDEFVLHELADGDLGLVCELDLLNMRRECMFQSLGRDSVWADLRQLDPALRAACFNRSAAILFGLTAFVFLPSAGATKVSIARPRFCLG